ncbi:hypothetical protein [Acetobacterium wieringae]|uniref:hypothetical protein n=1 Tax=Acetobacterium wieringae TaxID=52694 RepID=UPI002B2027EA|nr:hypothetical protein [Acetobacterium wieringae]MEA4807167.1 hypothetical protein [Acetobacterium wieringae]
MKTLETQFGHSNQLNDDGSVIGIHDDLDLIRNYFTPAFMKKHTVFTCLDDFLQSAGFLVSTQQDFEQIPLSTMNAWVQQNSQYLDWTEIVAAAGDFYFDNQMKAIKFKYI